MPPTKHHFSDRLIEAVERKGSPVCVGIDPVLDRLPEDLRRNVSDPESALAAISEFCSEVLDAVADVAPAVKFQSACFERYRHDGVETLYELIEEANRLDVLVILDAKRGDIGISAQHYADAAFNPPQDDRVMVSEIGIPDAITVNSYLGADGIIPFCRNGRGAFALVRTSNPGGDALQQARLEDGSTIAQYVAQMIARLGEECLGEKGYSNLGAVVGATKVGEMARLRQIMPHNIFLVPGYGAQGGSAEDVAACFNAHDGRGALISASRSIIYAFAQKEGKIQENDSSHWIDAIADSAAHFAADVARMVPQAENRRSSVRH